LKLSMRWFYAEAQATVLLNDGFAVLDRERSPMSTSWAANGSDWFDVSGDASANVTRFRLSRASPTTAGTIRLVSAIGSTPDSSTARSAASTARGASRSFWQWASLSPLARVTGRAARAAPHRLEPIESGSVRALFERRLLPLASGVDAAFVALWTDAKAKRRSKQLEPVEETVSAMGASTLAGEFSPLGDPFRGRTRPRRRSSACSSTCAAPTARWWSRRR
jgi:hypothetical protein